MKRIVYLLLGRLVWFALTMIPTWVYLILHLQRWVPLAVLILVQGAFMLYSYWALITSAPTKVPMKKPDYITPTLKEMAIETHICTSYRDPNNPHWVIFRCPLCPDYERRFNWATGESWVDRGTSTALHEGLHRNKPNEDITRPLTTIYKQQFN